MDYHYKHSAIGSSSKNTAKTCCFDITMCIVWMGTHSQNKSSLSVTKSQSHQPWTLKGNLPEQQNTHTHTSGSLPDVKWTWDHKMWTLLTPHQRNWAQPLYMQTTFYSNTVWSTGPLVRVDAEFLVGSREQIWVLLVVNFYQTWIVQN